MKTSSVRDPFDKIISNEKLQNIINKIIEMYVGL